MQLLEQMNIVIVGHVDHGKSTLIGRLLADTGSLPEGKLEQVKRTCERNAKPFEYAFLLDALKDEQAQGITIDTARSFFKSKKRSYIIIDAPGHIEFLKNMITGAARAEAALLLIDAKEGVQENSRRHGFMLSLLGIKQVVVLVNKMDLVHYQQDVFDRVKKEYSAFLSEINVTPMAYIPIAAREGDNLIRVSEAMPWYSGQTVLDQMDAFVKEEGKANQPLRFPVQDIYKFTESEDDRRIVAGTVQAGTLSVGDKVTFYPSQKSSVVHSIESFNTLPKTSVQAGEATGVTLTTQLYIKPGELMTKSGDKPPEMGSQFKASVFWLGKTPMVSGKKYKLKLAASRATVVLKEIVHILDASDLTQSHKKQIERHDVAECVFQSLKPMAFDLSQSLEETGRFVVIDDYEIAGGGIITENLVSDGAELAHLIESRDQAWEKSAIPSTERAAKFGQKPLFILISGPSRVGKIELAKALESLLYGLNKNVYYLGIANILSEIGSAGSASDRDDHLQKLGLTAHMFTEAGLILISTISDIDDSEAQLLQTLISPAQMMVISVGESALSHHPVAATLDLTLDLQARLDRVKAVIYQSGIILDYYL